MRLVTNEEFDEIRFIIKERMVDLAKIENKNAYLVQSAKGNCYVGPLNNDSQLFRIYSPAFINVIENDYISALKETPELFGTGNAKDVIHALFIQAQQSGWPYDEDRYMEYLSNEHFCLLLCKRPLGFDPNVLRIDLFRIIEESKDSPGCFDFVGGLFHALKHFSVNEQCASLLPNQNVNLYDIEQLIMPIADAFFMGVWGNGKKLDSFQSVTSFLNKQFTLAFFRESQSNVSFVDSLIPSSK